MKKIIIKKPLFGQETLVGKGAEIYIEYAPPTMIKFLRSKYEEDPECLKGDIEYLFNFEGLKPEYDDEELIENYEQFLAHVWNGRRKKGEVNEDTLY